MSKIVIAFAAAKAGRIRRPAFDVPGLAHGRHLDVSLRRPGPPFQATNEQRDDRARGNDDHHDP
jgi:hypothetical protein